MVMEAKLLSLSRQFMKFLRKKKFNLRTSMPFRLEKMYKRSDFSFHLASPTNNLDRKRLTFGPHPPSGFHVR